MILALLESSIQLVPDGTLLLHLALVVVMVAVLNVTLLKPINKVLEERERRTKGKLGDAEATVATVQKKIAEWESGLRNARNQGYKLLEQERLNALRERELHIAELKAELSALVSAEKAAINKQRQEAMVALKDEAYRLAALIGSQILGRSVGA